MKLRMILARAARRLPPMLLLAAVTLLFFGIVEGRIRLPFTQREAGDSFFSAPLYSPVSDPRPAQNGGEETSELPRGTRVSLPRVSAPQNALKESDLARIGRESGFVPFSVSPGTVPVLRAAGFSLSTEPYTADSAVLAFAGGFDFLPRLRAYYDASVAHVRYEQHGEGAPEPVYESSIEEVPAVQLYMGLMLVDDSSETAVYSSDGLFLTKYKSGEYARAYTRDRAGNPLFSRRETEEVEMPGEDGEESRVETRPVTRYYAVSAAGFTPAEYDDAVDGRGLYFDYAPSYGLSDNRLLRLASRLTTVTQQEDGTETSEESMIWAYAYSAGWALTNYRFSDARDFSEGLAAVTDEEGRLYYINQNGYQAFYTESSYYYYERYVTDYLLPPLTSGPESIGFYYYDHGLVRARRQVVDYWALYYTTPFLRVARDYDFLMDTAGQEFPLPRGYRLVAYSDGVALLEKDGRYGYLDHTGAWIAQPIYDYAQPFSEGLAVAGFKSGTRLMLDTEGHIVIPLGQYEYISSVSSGVVAAYSRAGGWEILHKLAKFS